MFAREFLRSLSFVTGNQSCFSPSFRWLIFPGPAGPSLFIIIADRYPAAILDRRGPLPRQLAVITHIVRYAALVQLIYW